MLTGACVLVVALVAAVGSLVNCHAVPPAPSSAPALPNIPGISSIVEDLMKVVEKAKSRWDALQHNYANSNLLGNILFPNKRKGPSRVDATLQQARINAKHNNVPFQRFFDDIDGSIEMSIPASINSPIKRSSHIRPVAAVPYFVPKNVRPSVKLIHRPASPVSNCLYTADGSPCADQQMTADDWEDLFSNVELTEY